MKVSSIILSLAFTKRCFSQGANVNPHYRNPRLEVLDSTHL
jgi:hypothetical protein